MPICSDCGLEKPETEYSFAGKYRFRYCKACNVIRAQAKYHAMTKEERKEANKRRRGEAHAPENRRKRYAEDPEYRAKAIASARANYAKVRAKIVTGYGAKCSCCGETTVDFLELDHVNGGGAAEYRETPPVNVYRRLIREGFPAGYTLLCSNCNLGRWRNGGVCPHKA